MTPERARRGPALKLLEVVGLSRRVRGRTALDAVSFTVEEGEILGLVGPPGAGKTACLDCLSGFLTPDTGRVILDGREVTGDSPRHLARAGMARALRTALPFRRLTVAGHAMVALAQRRVPMPAALLAAWRGPAARRPALELLRRAGLDGLAELRAELLAPGMLRRLQMIRAVALAPRLLVVDEPLAGLGPDDAAGVLDLIRALRADGLTILLAGRVEAAGVVDRVVRLDRGRVVIARPAARVAPTSIRARPTTGTGG